MTQMRIGVETGGTFADIIAVGSDGKLYGRKVPSTPADLSACFLAGVEAVLEAYPSAQPRPAMLLHGTTVATNALIENRFPTIGLIVTEGFREILQVTRYVAPTERDSAHTEMPPPQVVPLELVHEVRERIDAQGTVRLGLDDAQIRTVARWYQQKGVRIVAVSLLHSYANPSHERKIKDILQAEYRDVTVVLSSDVLPEFREYERTITTCLQAALIPVLGHYVEQLGRQIQARTWRAPLFVMQSSGGIRSAHAAIRKPLSTVLSGPSAAGVGMAWLGMQAGFPDLITLDMGGTSTDVSLVRNGQLQVTTSGHVHGYPLRMPTVDVVSIGAGGGSVAWWGREGRLHVGPRSAGAEPGPVCYGQGGDEVTVTDAHLVLGRLPHALLDGTLTLNRTAAEAALAEFG
jgi:N-methylhydantoinase A